MQVGIIYFIQPKEFVNTQVYKIGYSGKTNLERPIKYGIGSRYLCIMECILPFYAEQTIKHVFSKKFKSARGQEYFEGDETQMLPVFIDAVLNHKKIYQMHNPDNINNINEPKEDDAIQENVIIQENYELDKTKLKIFNTDYFNSLLSYDIKKKYFEEFVFKVMTPDTRYVYKTCDNRTNIPYNKNYTGTELNKMFRHLCDNQKNFIKKWIRDPQIRVYENLYFKPYNNIEKCDDVATINYNTFRGYNSCINLKTDNDLINNIIKPWLHTGLLLCENNTEYFDYYLNWLSYLIQQPHTKLSIPIIFQTKDNEEINLHFNAISDIIGKQYCVLFDAIDITNNQNILSISNKIMATYKGYNSCQKFTELMKLISMDSVTLSSKNYNEKIQLNASSIIICDDSFIFDISKNKLDAQFFKCVNDSLHDNNDFEFFTIQKTLFESPIFISSLYHFLNNRNVDEWNVNLIYKNTKAITNIINIGKPKELLFLEKYIMDTESKMKIKGIDLFKQYGLFVLESKLDIIYNISMKEFYTRIYNLKNNGIYGIEKCTISGGVACFVFNKNEIIKSLNKQKGM
jgi:hypothetical protein